MGGKEERLAKGTKDLCGLEENVLYLRSIKQMTCNPFILFKEGDMGTPQRKEQRQPTSLISLSIIPLQKTDYVLRGYISEIPLA